MLIVKEFPARRMTTQNDNAMMQLTDDERHAFVTEGDVFRIIKLAYRHYNKNKSRASDQNEKAVWAWMNKRSFELLGIARENGSVTFLESNPVSHGRAGVLCDIVHVWGMLMTTPKQAKYERLV